MKPVIHPVLTRVVAAAWWLGLASACSAAESPEAAAELRVGERLPAMGLSGEWPALVWVFAVEQCMGCELGDPARAVRAVQRRLGERIEIAVVAVGEGREEEKKLVIDFLASLRVSARVETRTLEQYLRGFGSGPLSVFYVANRQAVIEAAVAADSAETWRSAGEGLDLVSFVELIVNEEVASTGEGSGMQ